MAHFAHILHQNGKRLASLPQSTLTRRTFIHRYTCYFGFVKDSEVFVIRIQSYIITGNDEAMASFAPGIW